MSEDPKHHRRLRDSKLWQKLRAIGSTRGGRLLKKLASRKAPWWVKLGRTLTLTGALLVGIDQVALPNLPGRPLTPNETTMLRDVFGDAVAYNKIRVHHSAMADLYLRAIRADGISHKNLVIMPRNKDCADYGSTTDDYLQYTLMHEACHIWQEQNGLMPHALQMAFHNYTKFIPGHDHLEEYRYDLRNGQDLTRYNIEQQASIITDFHMSVKRGYDPLMHKQSGADLDNLMPGYIRTLEKFHKDPRYVQRR